jgi:hypothetical protein
MPITIFDLAKTTLADMSVVSRSQKPKDNPLKQFNIVLLGGSEVDKAALAMQVNIFFEKFKSITNGDSVLRGE